MVLASNLRFTLIEKKLDKFSCVYPDKFYNFSLYVNNEEIDTGNIRYRPQFTDFYIRPHNPSELDVLITVWIIGNLNNKINLFSFSDKLNLFKIYVTLIIL